MSIGDASTPQVPALVQIVSGRHGRPRLLLIVNCPACLEKHAHTAPIDFETGPRTAPCGYRYTLLTTRGPQAAA